MAFIKPINTALFILLGVATAAQAQAPAARPVHPRITAEEANRLIGGPTRITLNVENVATREVLAEFVKQAGLSTNPSNIPLRNARDPITLQLDAQPFWLAVKALSTKGRYGFNESGSSSSQTMLQPTGGVRGLNAPAVVNGPFVITVSELKRTYEKESMLREVDAPPAKVTDTLNVQLNVFIDPKVRAVPYANRVVLQQATDDKGNSLLGDNAETPYNSAARFILHPSLYLNTGATGGTRIAQLKGEFRSFIATKYDEWELPDPLQIKDATRIGAGGEATEKYTIKEVRKNDNGYAITVAVVRPDLGFDLRAAGEITLLDLMLFDQDGNRLDQAGVERSMMESAATRRQPGHAFDGIVTIATPRGRNATTLAEPTRLVWRIPVEFKEVVVPFEFKDLPLPFLP